jgi:hypothetical protein
LLAASAQSPANHARSASSPTSANRLQPYVAPIKLFALSKPADWIVTPVAGADSYSINVASPDRKSQVNLLWIRASQPDLLRFISACRSTLARSYPDIAFSKTYISRDNKRGLAMVAYQMGGIESQGRAYFDMSATGGFMQQYAAPARQLAAQRPLMMNVIASVAFINPPKGGAAAQTSPLQIALVDRRAADGSWTIKMPADWQFTGQKGRILAGQPGGSMGFIVTAFSGNPGMPNATLAQGIIGARYQSPDQTLSFVLRGFGHRNIAIKSSTPDQAAMKQCPAFAHVACDAANLVAEWTSKEGAECVGSFKVTNNHPGAMGVWSTSIIGIWGPRKDIERYYPALKQIDDSFAINGKFARDYIAAGLENLQREKARTAQAIADLNYTRQDMQRAWEDRQARQDYMNSKWDDYRRGNSYWVSDLEGGKVYHTDTWGTKDTETGDYYEGKAYNWTNFEGQNPRYPSEDMREISSYELEHGSVLR